MITANNEAIDAMGRAFAEAKMMAVRVDEAGRPIKEPLLYADYRGALAEMLVAAIPYVTDAGQPLTCNVQAGESLKSTCICGHRVSRHESIDGEIRCNECNAQPRPGTVESRIDGLVDVVLRAESRLLELIESLSGDRAVPDLAARLDQIDEALASLKTDDAMQVEAVNRAWHRGRNSGLEQGRSEGVELTELDTGPTDYDVWRDALTLATSERAHIDPDTGHIKTGLLARALWFRDELKRPIRDAPNSEHPLEPLGEDEDDSYPNTADLDAPNTVKAQSRIDD